MEHILINIQDVVHKSVGLTHQAAFGVVIITTKTLVVFENLQQLRIAKKLSEEIEASEIEATEKFNKKITENEIEIQAAIDKIVRNTQESAIEVAVEAINRLTGQLPDKKEINSAIERALKIQN